MKLKIAAIIAASVLLLTGCQAGTGGAGDDGDFHVAFANFAEDIPVYHSIHEKVDALNKAGSGVKVSWYSNDSDPATMLSNVTLMIQSKPDAIVLLPVSQATEGVSRLLKESGIPCVSVNLVTPACSFLNIDNMDLGVQTAKVVGEAAKAKGWNASNTVVLLGQAAASGEQVNDCVRYFYSTIADELGFTPTKPSDITPTTTRIGDNGIQFDGQESLEVSHSAVTSLISTIPKDKNIILYTTNSDATRGAMRALEERDRGGDDTLLIGGLSGDSSSLESLLNDPRWVAEGDIFIDHWGEYAIAMAQAIAGGAKPTAEVTPLPQIVFAKADLKGLKEIHPTPTKLAALPPLVAGNEYLSKSSFLKFIGNVTGVK